MDVVTVFLPYI